MKCKVCGSPGPRHKWDAIKNFTDWFFTRDGACYCPEHLPDWVAGWRRSRADG